MSTRKKTITTISFIVTLLIFVISIYYACKSNGKNANLYTIISGWISGVATLATGLLSLWLNYKIDQVSKHKDELRNKEVNEQYLNTLRLNASPIIYFDNIECLNFSQNGIIISNSEFVNRLLDNEIVKDNISATQRFSFELIFKTPKAENVENIYIQSVDLHIKKLDGFGNEYKHRFVNYSSNKKANLKYTDKGCLACHTDLLYLQDDDDEVFTKLNSVVGKGNTIVFMMDLIASNSLGLSKTYSCGFYFNILNKQDCNYHITNYEIKIIDNVMWAEEVVIDSKHKQTDIENIK